MTTNTAIWTFFAIFLALHLWFWTWAWKNLAIDPTQEQAEESSEDKP